MSPCPKSCVSCPVWTKSLFRSLTKDEVAQLAAEKTALSLKRQDELFGQGDATRGLYCLSEGLVRVEQRGPSGKSRFIRLALPGDTAGHRSVFVDKTYKGTATIIADYAEACFIPSSTLLRLLGHSPNFAVHFVQKIAVELEKSEEDRLAIKEKTVRSRLAEILAVLGQKYADRTSHNSALLKSELSKVDLARMLSVADETVIRLMTEFKNDGLIGYAGRRIHVLNSGKLSQIADAT